eukprot:8580049-Alexandrium_andersonii.AAC.1
MRARSFCLGTHAFRPPQVIAEVPRGDLGAIANLSRMRNRPRVLEPPTPHHQDFKAVNDIVRKT